MLNSPGAMLVPRDIALELLFQTDDSLAVSSHRMTSQDMFTTKVVTLATEIVEIAAQGLATIPAIGGVTETAKQIFRWVWCKTNDRDMIC